MPDIRVFRAHQLGLPKARLMAAEWVSQAAAEYQLKCTLITGDGADTVMFTRAGVDGRLVVAPDHFALDAKLGFLLGGFSRKIEAEIENNLSALLDNSQPDDLTAKAVGETVRPQTSGAPVAKRPK